MWPNDPKLSRDGTNTTARECGAKSAIGVGSGASLCENSFSDHSIHLLVSSKCAIS
jgi:hypothetical protein